MGKKLPPNELALYTRLDEILWNDWDPIGVNNDDRARDEYRGYLPFLYALAKEGADVDRIADELTKITEGMGLSANRKRDRMVAKSMVRAKQEALG